MTATRVHPPHLPLLLCLVLSCGGGGSVTSPVGDDDGPGNGGPPAPLAVVQTDPADGATDVETGARVVATFNRAPDPASLTASSFSVALGGIELPGRILHQAGSALVTLVTPLLPGVELDYEVTVGTEVRDPEGQPLGQPHQWRFRTRASRHVVVPTDGNDGEQTSLALDEAGGVHASHVGDGNVTYSTCASMCTTASAWQSAVIDGGGRSTSLRVDGNGRRHLVYYGANNELRYATCAAQCESPPSWTIATIDPITGDSRVSLALDRSGALHVAYYDAGFQFLKYAVCPADCGDPANWGVTVPDLTGAIGREASLAIDAAGRLHVATHDELSDGLAYATCANDCLGNGWQSEAIDPANGAAESAVIAVGGDGRLHVAYQPGDTDDLRYASCGGGCLNPAAWETTIVHPTPEDAGEFVAIAVDDVDRLYLTYWVIRLGTERLFLATCASSCTDAASWQSTTIDGGGRVGRYNAVAVDPRGRIHVTYYDQDRRDLKYLE